MDWQDIEQKLCERAEEVCRHLLPSGHAEGNNYVCGDLDGKPGDSLKVNVGEKAGVWRDFAAGTGGKTLMSLWCAVRSQPFKVCIREAKEFLGIRDDFDKRIRSYQPTEQSQREAESASYKAVSETWGKLEPLDEAGPVWRYLTETRRLAPSAVRDFGVREFTAKGGIWVMVFPYFGVTSEAEAVRADISQAVMGTEQAPAWLKFERLDRPDGKKKEWTSKAPEKSLFGVQLAELPRYQKCRHLLICEGEKDAMTWASYGCAEWGVLPVSVPFGAKWRGQDPQRPSPNREWLDRCWDWMQGFETVFVAMDSDEAGRRASADIIAEIGQRRCRLVELPKDAEERPFKDANDCLIAEVTAQEMRYALDNARDFAPENVVPASEFYDAYMEEWFEKHLEPGLQLPFGFPWRVRLGELTIWTGIEKSGKTTLLSFVLIALMAQGERAFVASYEIKPVKTLKKLSRQAFGGLIYDKRRVDKATADGGNALANYQASARQDATDTFKWFENKLWLNTVVGIGRWRELGDDIRWCVRRYGIRQFVIDNFMRLGIAKDDYAQQADAITFFAALAMELNIHIHVVVHQNKSEGGKNAGGKRTVSGAFEIIANAHNIVEVQRDERKGQEMKELFQKYEVDMISEAQFKQDKAQLDLRPDGKFVLHAQRDGEDQNGSKYLWFLWESQQYADKPAGHADHAPLRFVRESKRLDAERNGPSGGPIPSEEEMNFKSKDEGEP